MTDKPLTMAVWTDLVADEIVPAYTVAGLPVDFAAHADWVGRRLIDDGWTVAQARWCVAEATMTEMRFGNLLAMLGRANAGRQGFDGTVQGGWRNSREYHDTLAADRLDRERAECVTDYRDGRCAVRCGTLARCRDCPVLAEQRDDRTGRMVKAGGE